MDFVLIGAHVHPHVEGNYEFTMCPVSAYNEAVCGDQ